MSSSTLTLDEGNFKTEVLDSTGPVLVDAYADWCAPCRALGPVLDQLAEEFDGRVKVGKLDVDSNAETAAVYEVSSIPTVLVFNEGKVVEKIVGLHPKERYSALLDELAA